MILPANLERFVISVTDITYKIKCVPFSFLLGQPGFFQNRGVMSTNSESFCFLYSR